MKKKLIFVTLSLVAAFASMCVSVEGFSLILLKFTGKTMSFWNIFLLSMGWRMLTNNKFIMKRKIEDEVELFGNVITALIINAVAVYLILPYALQGV